MLVAVEDRESEEVQAELGRLVVDDEAFLARLKPLYAADVLDGIGKLLAMLRGRAVGSGGVGVEVAGENEDEDVFADESPSLTTEEAIELFN